MTTYEENNFEYSENAYTEVNNNVKKKTSLLG